MSTDSSVFFKGLDRREFFLLLLLFFTLVRREQSSGPRRTRASVNVRPDAPEPLRPLSGPRATERGWTPAALPREGRESASPPGPSRGRHRYVGAPQGPWKWGGPPRCSWTRSRWFETGESDTPRSLRGGWTANEPKKFSLKTRHSSHKDTPIETRSHGTGNFHTGRTHVTFTAT